MHNEKSFEEKSLVKKLIYLNMIDSEVKKTFQLWPDTIMIAQ